MGGQIFDPGGSPFVDPGEAPSPDGTTPGVPAGGPTYIKIVVPNFRGHDPDGNLNPMGSYLRIGAVEPSPYSPGTTDNPVVNGVDPTGEDLAAYVTTFADDLRHRTDGATDAPPAAPETLPPGTPAVALAGETAVLHSKGGWRDHTDGNRITTTRGDKIEVIRGNYKMLILGRQNLGRDPTGDYYFDDWATGYDESGGLSDNSDQAHGVNGVLDISYSWQKNSDGRWGWTQITKTGTFDTSDLTTGPPLEQHRTTQGNGKQIEFTWVDQMMAITGGPDSLNVTKTADVLPTDGDYDRRYEGDSPSVKKRVDLVYNRTWVNVLDELTDATGAITEVVQTASTYDSTTTSGGDMNTTAQTTTGNMTSVTSSGGTMTTTAETPTGGSMTNHVSSGGSISNHTTSSGWIYETTSCAGVHSSFDMPLVMLFELALSLIHLEVHAALVHAELHAGFHVELHVLPHLDAHLLGHYQSAAGSFLSLAEDSVWFAAAHSTA